MHNPYWGVPPYYRNSVGYRCSHCGSVSSERCFEESACCNNPCTYRGCATCDDCGSCPPFGRCGCDFSPCSPSCC
ncbi:hypothetical protein LJB83_02735, partial [Clostridia bacterium OttesenSCG-928-F22]|nr:hypothetical protein [Clostridia bacterium OttesenSCG-928-F22]